MRFGNGNPDQGLRDLRNHLKLSEVSSEVHQRSLPYSGLWWDLFVDLGGTVHQNTPHNRDLFNFLAKWRVATDFHPISNRPAPADHIREALAALGAMSLAGSIPEGMTAKKLHMLIISKAELRELLTKDEADQLRQAPLLPTAPTALYLQSLASLGSHISFTCTHELGYFAGWSQHNQQLYHTETMGWLPVMGGTLMVQRGPKGHTDKISHFSLKDIYRLDEKSVDENMPISFPKAIYAAWMESARRVQRLRLEIELAKIDPATASGKPNPKTISRLQMQLRAAKTSYLSLGRMVLKMIVGKPPHPEHVIDPDSKTIHYTISAGLETCKICSKSGRVIFESGHII